MRHLLSRDFIGVSVLGREETVVGNNSTGGYRPIPDLWLANSNESDTLSSSAVSVPQLLPTVGLRPAINT